MTDLVARLREAIDETERNAHRFHEQDCDALMGVGGGHGVCDCGEPDRRLRRCAADRKILNRAGQVLTAGADDRDADGVLLSVPIARRHMRAIVRDLAEAYGVEA